MNFNAKFKLFTKLSLHEKYENILRNLQLDAECNWIHMLIL